MLGVMVDERPIRERWLVVREALDERSRRLWAAAEARSHGRGGIAAVVRATGLSDATVRRGIVEVEHGEPPAEGRIRRAGGGRRSITETLPGLDEALLGLLDGVTRGDPESPLLWTSRSVSKLTQALRERGFEVHESTTRRRLRSLGFSLQANRKTHEGADHPDRDRQFAHIAEVSRVMLAAQQPLVSIDCKKKELIGPYKNGGRELAPTGKPILVNTHDFIDPEQGKAIPYGIYDVGRNEGWVSVGISAETAQFAVASIKAWWEELGRERYPNATTLTITADCGGSNGYRLRLWKTELQKLANQTGLRVSVMHYPPGTSKWNKIEHRLFSYISINWRAKPLLSRQAVIDLIASTTTTTGLKVYARLDPGTYQTKIPVSDQQMREVNIQREQFHPEWNYTIIPTVI